MNAGLARVIYSIARPLEFLVQTFKGGSMLKVGDKAPDFKVRTHEGKQVNLSDFAGKSIVLWFFPKADTPG